MTLHQDEARQGGETTSPPVLIDSRRLECLCDLPTNANAANPAQLGGVAAIRPP